MLPFVLVVVVVSVLQNEGKTVHQWEDYLFYCDTHFIAYACTLMDKTFQIRLGSIF